MKVDQCLFGYNDGHKLLATSLSLGSETSTLTELSDMAPGIVFGKSGGYWTGVPAPSIGRYVLMRTWPAPEMPRPGCVWTHALLIDPNVLELLEDLAVLQKSMSRPSNQADISQYREPLQLAISAGRSVVDSAIVTKLLIALYQRDRAVVDTDFAGEIDDPLFAVWSQQWPRLRRNLRFQTAAAHSHHPAPGVRFDLSTKIAAIPESDLSPAAALPWMSAALLDIQQGSGELRDFLWRYGSDVKRQRKSFRPLVELYVMDRDLTVIDGHHIMQIVRDSFPSQQDALLLKQDLVDGVVMPPAQPAAISAFFHEMAGSGLPPPTLEGIQRLAELWDSQSAELLAIADEIADAVEPIAQLVFGACISRLKASKFWSATSDFPKLQDRLLRERPELLLEEGSLQLGDDRLADLLALVPENAVKLPYFISLLLSKNNKKIADSVFDAFPRITSEQLLNAENSDLAVGQAWRSSILSRPNLLLTSAYLGCISRTSLLYDYFVALGGFVPQVLAGGVGPWGKALEESRSDLNSEQENALKTFILILALRTGNQDGQRVVEALFDTIHAKVLRDKLQGEARTILLDCLPELGWFSNWDVGFRLRLMVTAAYIQNDWSPQSFADLTQDSKVRSMLADAAKEFKSGKQLYKAITG
ncbi:hypothetical protein [Pseudomonas sp. ME-P-057]|uniref:GAP1-N1 domain-containing protein n=1 Tax=Pseudomonas sp. ME-P-057 TaxID=3040321 RepID=UPI002555AB5A|nr:hypothetical protein [Pseudomonas sp. ME-P-057]